MEEGEVEVVVRLDTCVAAHLPFCYRGVYG